MTDNESELASLILEMTRLVVIKESEASLTVDEQSGQFHLYLTVAPSDLALFVRDKQCLAKAFGHIIDIANVRFPTKFTFHRIVENAEPQKH